MQERIRAENITKRYGGRDVLDKVSLTAHMGECLGVFGLSGSGKSTFIRILAGTESPDFGTISSADIPAVAMQTPSFDAEATLAEVLWLAGSLYGIPKGKRRTAVRDVLAVIGLDSERDQRIRMLSESQRKKLEIGRALVSGSDLLLMDEPMTGLDPETRSRMWEHLLNIREYDKKTIILATSRPEDAELCDRIALLHAGHIIALGTLSELRHRVGPETLVVQPAKKSVAQSRGIVTARQQEDAYIVEVGTGEQPVELLKQIHGGIAAVRTSPRGVDSILAELIADG